MFGTDRRGAAIASANRPVPCEQLRRARGIRVIALCVGVLSVFASTGWTKELLPDEKQPPSAAKSPIPHSYCGVQCLYLALRALGKDVSFSDLVRPEYISSKKGSSVGDLKRAGHDWGAFVEPMGRMTCGMLQEVRLPVILHVKSRPGAKDYDHWVLFMGTEGGRAKLYNGEQPAKLMGFDELAARWDGTGVLVSDAPIDTTGLRLPSLLFATGFAALTAGALVRFERLRRTRRQSASWLRSVCSSLPQAAGLLVVTVGTMSAYRVLSAAGFLSNPTAIAAIQDAHFGTFLPKVKTPEMGRLLDVPGVAIIDARNPTDFHAGHLPGAISIPVSSRPDEMERAMAAIPSDSRVIIYSHSNGCQYGDDVARELLALGYARLELYRGGWVEWEKHHPQPSQSKNPVQEEDRH